MQRKIKHPFVLGTQGKTEVSEPSDVLLQELADYNSPDCTSVLFFSPSNPNLHFTIALDVCMELIGNKMCGYLRNPKVFILILEHWYLKCN